MKEEHGMDSSRMNRGCCGANNMQNRRAASNNMELKMEPRNFPRKNAACRSYDTCNGVRSDGAV